MTKGGPDYVRFPAPDYVIFTDQDGNEEVLDSSTVLNPLGRYYEAMLGATSRATAEVVGVGDEGADDEDQNFFNPRAFIAYVAREGEGNRSSSLNLPHADLWGRADPARESHEVELAIPVVDSETRRVDITFAVADLEVNDGLIVLLEAEADGQSLSKQYRSANKGNELLIETITLVGVPGSASSVTARVVSPTEEISPQTGEKFHGPSIHWMGVHASSICEPRPDVEITKSTNGEDAPEEPGPTITVGDPITWTYEVTNTGNVDLRNITVTDNDENLEVECPQTTLAVGETITCTAEGTAQAGQYSNTGTVTGEDVNGEEVTGSDDSHYFGEEPDLPSVSITTRTNGEDAPEPTGPIITVGDPVTWTYEVTNTGDVTLVDLVVTDDPQGDVCTIDELGVGDTTTCELTGTAQPGQYSNTGFVTAQDGDGNEVSDEDDSHYFGEEPGMPSVSITTRTNGEDAPEPTGPIITVGDPVTWTYEVTNTGDVTLVDLVVTDDPQGDVCTIDELGVGDTTTCELTGTAQPGQYSNTGFVTAQDGDGNEVSDEDDSHYFGAEPEVTFVKRTNGREANNANDPDVPEIVNQGSITWTYEVTNTGTIAIPGSDIVISDDQIDDADIQLFDSSDGNTNMLNPGATWVYRATGTALDLTYGENDATVVDGCDSDGTGVTRVTYRNVGTVTINDLTISNSSHYCNPEEPTYLFNKTTNNEFANDPHGFDVPIVQPGEQVKWSYYLNNTGNLSIPRELVFISDDQLDDADIELIASSDGDLDRLNPGAFWTFRVFGPAVDLSDPNVDVTTVAGCTQGGSRPERNAYRNIGTATVNGFELSDISHYCNPEP